MPKSSKQFNPRAGLARTSAAAALLAFAIAANVHAQAEPDVLTLTDGEKLIGHLLRSTAEKVTFKSDLVGEVTIAWSKIQELHSAQPFAVIQKNVRLHRREDMGNVPRGAVTMKDQKIEVKPAGDRPAQTVAVPDAAYVVDDAVFQRIFRNPGFFEAWKGAISAGVALVEATQKSETFTGAINMVRTVPSEDWLDSRNRTTFNFSASEGKLTQPNTPNVKTSIHHADAEGDEYFSPRVYAFGQAAFDHNFSQGLALQQSYGGGIGWTAVKQANQTLDLKASMSYVSQRFEDSTLNQNLTGSTFGEVFMRKFAHGIQLNEQLAVNPAWNNLNAYSATGSVGLALPVYKRFGLSANTADSFLNNPPPGFKKNSFQFTTGLTYTLP